MVALSSRIAHPLAPPIGTLCFVRAVAPVLPARATHVGTSTYAQGRVVVEDRDPGRERSERAQLASDTWCRAPFYNLMCLKI